MLAIKKELIELLNRNDLLRASLVVGKIADAGFKIEPYVEIVLELSARVWHQAGRLRRDPVAQAKVINEVLFVENGLRGKSEKSKQVIDDPSRFYLHEVLDGKQASPLALSILYSTVAEQIGLEHECIALPANYFLKMKDVTGDFYVEPYDSGRFLTAEEFQKRFLSSVQKHRLMSTSLYEKISAAQLVGRLVQQLKHIYILKGSALEALRAVELLTVLFPQSPELTRDRGILYCEMEYFSKAIEDLKLYLKERPEADDVKEIKKLAGMLRGYREVVN